MPEVTEFAAVPGFRPTHVVPGDGLPTWESPDASRPSAPLDPFLPVELLDRRGDWGRVLCANGWSTWVDGRLLVPVPQSPPPAGQPLARTADPRPLLDRAEELLGRYRRAVDDLAEQRTDGEAFRRATQGMRVGMVVDGESMWLYEAEHERWVYCDGDQLTVFVTEGFPPGPGAVGRGAAPGGPGSRPDAEDDGPSARPPTQIVSHDGTMPGNGDRG
ncbi:hypothetical protein ABZ532_26325 [Streptomyces sp. NPDC019396]|uniref:hypothetical protein n=1 Tax=Streptomyces sp. NPDC019396 TaxID=3154687 RepID=UPI0034054EB8